VDPGRWPISAKIIRLWSGPGGGQPWVAAGFNLRIAEPTRPPNPNGVDLAEGRPLQSRSHFSPSLSKTLQRVRNPGGRLTIYRP
jgi:hypothetical protein